MSGTSSIKPPQGSSAWTLFPSTFIQGAETNMQSPPSIIIEESPSPNLESQQPLKPVSDHSKPLDSTPLDITNYRSHRLRDLERPDISAIRKEVLEGPTTSIGAPMQEAFPTRPRRHSGSAKFIPPRSSSRADNPEGAAVKREHQATMSAQGPKSPSTSGSISAPRSRSGSTASYQTNATSLPALQQRPLDEHDSLEPLCEDDLDPGSFDLVAPPDRDIKQYSLESRSELLFSAEHLKVIFKDPSLFLRFTGFLSSERPSSVPILLYYLDAVKALKALDYANAVGNSLETIRDFEFTSSSAQPTQNLDLESKANKAFEVLVRDDLPAYIASVYIQTVSVSIQRRITGTLPPHLREASEGLAEVFCLTDPARPDNPIVFASEEFHRTTQYGMSYVIGKNCRFLQGPKTNQHSVKRLSETIKAGKEHCEVFLNYRRDGSPFMNLLMTAPLCDSRGTIRYFIGAQVDVSGLVKECSDLESLKRLVVESENADSMQDGEDDDDNHDRNFIAKSKFQELSEMLNMEELETVRRRGGRMRQYNANEDAEDSKPHNWNKTRLQLGAGSPDGTFEPGPLERPSGRLSGIYENYLLVRPYPSLRILFASPSLRIPGILQSPFMNKVGGSGRIREELTRALADGRGVTAKIRWLATRNDTIGRNRWVHCTPLLGNNGAVGVWMIVVADDDDALMHKKYKIAPPVDPNFGRNHNQNSFAHQDDTVSLGDFARTNGAGDSDSYAADIPRYRDGDRRSASRAGGPASYRTSVGSMDDGGSGSVRL